MPRCVVRLRFGAALFVAILGWPGRAPAFTFSAPVAVDDSRPAAEPGIAVDSAGIIYINAPQGLESLGPSRVWRSTDGGSSFTHVGPPNVSPSPNVTIGGGDSDLAIGAGDALYFVDLWLVDASTAVSTNGGATWTGVPFGTVPIQDRPWVSADPTTPGLVYSVTDQVLTGLWISKALPGGLLAGAIYPISVPEILTIDRGIVGSAPPGNLVTNKKGDTYNVYAIFTGTTPGQWGIGLSELPAGGLLTTNGAVPPADGAFDQTVSFPVVAVDNGTNDNLYVVWTDPVSATTWNIRFASFDGTTWSNAVTLGQGLFPWITVQAPGKVDVAWYSAKLSASNYAGDPSAAPADTIWDVAFAQSTNALSPTPTFTPAEVAASGIKTGKICTEGINCSGDRELADFLSITHDGSGHALIAYTFVPEANQARVRFVKQTAGATIN
jgi:hypothetical protein